MFKTAISPAIRAANSRNCTCIFEGSFMTNFGTKVLLPIYYPAASTSRVGRMLRLLTESKKGVAILEISFHSYFESTSQTMCLRQLHRIVEKKAQYISHKLEALSVSPFFLPLSLRVNFLQFS